MSLLFIWRLFCSAVMPKPLLQLPFEKMNEQVKLYIRDIHAIGNDWRITTPAVEDRSDKPCSPESSRQLAITAAEKRRRPAPAYTQR
jgi:hypothetical protein